MAVAASHRGAKPLWLSEEVYEDFLTVVNTIPESHLVPPKEGEQFATQDKAYQRLGDWAFYQGYALVKSRGASRDNIRMHCIHWGTGDSKNHRRITDETRKRKTNPNGGIDCPWEVRGGRDGPQWVIRKVLHEHNHPPAENPFSLRPNKMRKPNSDDVIMIDQGALGQVTMRLHYQGNKLAFHPPILNSASPWATTIQDLNALYYTPHTGAMTIRTSLLNGFVHDDAIHQYTFFEIDQMRNVRSGDGKIANTAGDATGAISSLNSIGYSPIKLQDYIQWILGIGQESLQLGIIQRKAIIFSVTGTPKDVSRCHQILTENAQENWRWFMEINLSCPNIPDKPPPAYSRTELLKYLLALSGRPNTVAIGIKTPPYTYQTQFDDLIGALLDSSAHAAGCPVSFITATNTLGNCLVFDEDEHAINTSTNSGLGGLAGASLHPLALGNVRTLRKMLNEQKVLRDISIIGVGGVSDAAGYMRMRKAGAAAVAIGTAFGVQGITVFEDVWKGSTM